MKKIIVASDSFKGSLSSAEVAAAVAEGVRDVYPECKVVCLEAGDGGEGTSGALMKALGGSVVGCKVHDPLMRPIIADYGISADGRTAVIDMAAASGLTLLCTEERNPLLTTTFGTGEMIADALRRGCRRVIVGLGGSATNDGGTGMLTALGIRFLDARGETLPGMGESLDKIVSADCSGAPPGLADAEFIAACDVESPLCGPRGAAYVYAPQKGADAAATEALDRGLRNFGEIAETVYGHGILEADGAGAAGGAGAGMMAYLHARMVPGAELLLDALDFDRLIADADLVITGEGRMDEQTLMGKLPLRVLRRATAHGIPVIALAGSVSVTDNPGFAAIAAVSPDGCPLEIAMKPEVAFRNLRRTAAWAVLAISHS